MAYFLHILDEDGHFELIDGDLAVLYPDLDFDELTELSDEQYQQCLALNGQQERFKNGKFFSQPVKPSPYHHWDGKRWRLSAENQTLLLKAEKTTLLQTLADKTDAFKSQFLAGYSQAEIDSFYRQEQEARGELPLMLLPELVAGREDIDDIEQLKAKVLEKADLLAIITGKLLAIKQNFEKKIEGAETLEALIQIQTEINQWEK